MFYLTMINGVVLWIILLEDFNVLQEGRCDETPSLCYPGRCINNLTNEGDFYSCDCTGTGYTGPECKIPGASSGCHTFEMPWCMECTASQESDCLLVGRWRACGNTDPVCQEVVSKDENGNVVEFKRFCVGRLDCPQFEFGVDSCEIWNDGSFVDCPPSQPLHCFTCHSYDDLGCWITGVYAECNPDSICSYTSGYNTSSPSGRLQVFRGCKPRSECTDLARNSAGGDCDARPGFCTKCEYGSAFPNLPEKKIAICGEPSQGTCSCKGDPHCYTFDEIYIDELPGACIYTFARDNCMNGQPIGPPSFVVSFDLKYLTNTKVSVHKVFVQYLGEVIKMGQDVQAVRVGELVTNILDSTEANPLRTDLNSIITYSAGAARIELPNQVVVEWDFKKQVAVHVPNTFMMQMCGICGNFDMHLDFDFVYGPQEEALAACPVQEERIRNFPSGQPVPSRDTHDLADFTLSWIKEEDHYEYRCHDDCHEMHEGEEEEEEDHHH